jgi:hypothetical protein
MVRFAVAAAEELLLAAPDAEGEELALVELLGVLLELPLLHAAAPVATVTASATAPSARLLRMVVSWGLCGSRHFRKFSNTFDVPPS